MTTAPRDELEDLEDGFLEDFLQTAFRSELAASDRSGDARGVHPAARAGECPARLGRYPVLGPIGHGGIGDVYRVEDPALGRELAIKVIRREHAQNPELLQRFEDEARLCSQLTHPGVVAVHEIGRLEDDRPYFTMKLVEGRTLASMLRQRATGSEEGHLEFLEILRKISETIAYVHAKGVVHGDLKPHNVMVGQFGEVQVMDWGFARATATGEIDDGTHAASSSSTRGGGTPAYMAPEQADPNGRLAPATDVFGLGGILCEILTGKPPYLAKTKREVIAMASDGKLDGARGRLEQSPADAALVSLALDCLAPRIEDRPPDAGALAARLTAYLDGLEERARTLELEAAGAQASLAQARRARRFAWAWMTSIVAGVVVAASLIVTRERDRDARRADLVHAVSEAVAETARLQSKARQSSDLAAWKDALAAARRAATLAATSDGTPRLRRRTDALVAEIELGYGRAGRKRALIQALGEIAPHLGDDRPPRELDTRFRTAFAAAGVSTPPTPASLAALRELGPEPALIHGLHSWMHVRRKGGIPHATAWRVPLRLVQALDPDLWRTVLRDAYAARDLDRLRAIAREEAVAERPAASLDFLAQCLYELGARAEAVRLYQTAHAAYPGDHGINHNLAVLLDRTKPANVRESIRLLSMALARQPADAHLRTDLGLYLIHDKQPDRAIDLLQQTRDLAPQSGRTCFVLGIAYAQAGRPEDAKEAYAAGARLGHPEAGLSLGMALAREGRLERALPVLRRSADTLPRNEVAALQLGLVLCRLYDFDAGLPLMRKAAELKPDRPEPKCRLGVSLLDAGRFREALGAARDGHDLATKSGWEGPHELWLRQTRGAAAAERRLAHLGEDPDDPEERAVLGCVARRKGMHAVAYRLLAPVIEVEWEPITGSRPRTEAALAAIALAPSADGERRRELAARALGWLQEELGVLEDARAAGRIPEPVFRETILRFRHHPDLARWMAQPSERDGGWRAWWRRVGELAKE